MSTQIPPDGPNDFRPGPSFPPPLSGMPPSAAGAPPILPGPLGYTTYQPAIGGPFGVREVLGDTWHVLWSQPGTFIGATILYLLISLAASAIPFVGGIASIFLGPLYVSTIYLFVRGARGQTVGVGDMFTVFGPRYWPLLAIYLLIMIAIIAAYIPAIIAIAVGIGVGAAGNWSEGATTVALIVGGSGFLVGMLILMFVAMRLWFATTLYMDAPTGSLDIIQAMRISWQTTARSWPTLVIAQFIIILAMLGCFLLLILPFFIIGMPLAFAFLGAAHARLFPLGDQGRCVNCGYDLRAVQRGSACPECGTIPGTTLT